MNALVYRSYGSPDVLRFEEVERPAPGDGEVLLEVHAASVNPLDWRILSGGPSPVRLLLSLGRQEVKRPGRDVAGRVEAVGSNVTRLARGHAVFGTCGGAFAEYAVALESALVPKPESVTFEQAASVPIAGLTALQALGVGGKVGPGQRVLIHGAAGGVGTFAVQIAKALGAHVTGVCSTGNVELVRSIGADRVVDYTRDDFTRIGRRYDRILDCIGNHSLSACRRTLNPRGVYVVVGGPKSMGKLLIRMLGALALSLVTRDVRVLVTKLHPADLTAIADLMVAGRVTPVIGSRYPLHQAADAVRHSAEGHARGKVVITVRPDAAT